MTSTRLQHVVPAGAVFVLAALVTWLSFTQEPVEAFLFPRIVSVVFIILAVWNLARAALGLAKVGGGIRLETAHKIAPGFAVMLVYAFWGAKFLGFYVGSSIAFFVLFSLYDPAPYSSARDWVKRVIVTAAFMAVIYGLFAFLLQVQTPRGMFI